MKNNSFYFLAGVFFILLEVLVVVRNYSLDFVYFFWFCDFVPILFALAFFLRKEQFVKGIVNIGFFPQVIYLFAFSIRLLFGFTFVSEIDTVLGHGFVILFSSLFLHFASIIAFLFAFEVKPKRESLGYSLAVLILMYVVGVIFTDSASNVNYVFTFSNFFGLEILSILWIPATFLVVVIPTYYFQVLVYRKFRK